MGATASYRLNRPAAVITHPNRGARCDSLCARDAAPHARHADCYCGCRLVVMALDKPLPACGRDSHAPAQFCEPRRGLVCCSKPRVAAGCNTLPPDNTVGLRAGSRIHLAMRRCPQQAFSKKLFSWCSPLILAQGNQCLSSPQGFVLRGACKPRYSDAAPVGNNARGAKDVVSDCVMLCIER